MAVVVGAPTQALCPLPWLQSQDTEPELFVEVLGVLAAAADAACGSGDGCGGSSDEAAGAAAGSNGVVPWQLMPGVVLQELLAFLVVCFQPGALPPPPRAGHTLLWSIPCLHAPCLGRHSVVRSPVKLGGTLAPPFAWAVCHQQIAGRARCRVFYWPAAGSQVR